MKNKIGGDGVRVGSLVMSEDGVKDYINDMDGKNKGASKVNSINKLRNKNRKNIKNNRKNKEFRSDGSVNNGVRMLHGGLERSGGWAGRRKEGSRMGGGWGRGNVGWGRRGEGWVKGTNMRGGYYKVPSHVTKPYKPALEVDSQGNFLVSFWYLTKFIL